MIVTGWTRVLQSNAAGQPVSEQYVIRTVRRLETGEMMLPSGRIAGNREYQVYYKQNLVAKPEKALSRMDSYVTNGQQRTGDKEDVLMLANADPRSEAELHKRVQRKAEKAYRSDLRRKKIQSVKYFNLN